MNRRKFLATLCGAGAALAVGPTLLALVPKPAPLPPLVFTFEQDLRPMSAADEALFYDRYIGPAAAALADRIDADLAAMVYGQFEVGGALWSEHHGEAGADGPGLLATAEAA